MTKRLDANASSHARRACAGVQPRRAATRATVGLLSTSDAPKPRGERNERDAATETRFKHIGRFRIPRPVPQSASPICRSSSSNSFRHRRQLERRALPEDHTGVGAEHLAGHHCAAVGGKERDHFGGVLRDETTLQRLVPHDRLEVGVGIHGP
jgi:hypothetical protein